MAPRKSEELPTDAFEKLRQCFDTLKEKHTDPWNWHEYLEEEKPPASVEDDDAELVSLKPKPRSNMERLKSHLLATVNELNRAAASADMCYFHMCASPQAMRDCVTILGTSGDIDEEMLNSGDVSPQKMMGLLQLKLERAHLEIEELAAEVTQLKDSLVESRTLVQERFAAWQRAALAAEEATTRLHWMTLARDESRRHVEDWREVYEDLRHRFLRAGRLMKYKARQLLRDRVFNVNKKETLFYCFHGLIEICRTQIEERQRREKEAERNATEFALRNEVRLLLEESQLHRGAVERLAVRNSIMKKDRRALAVRILYKYRAFENLEYCLWVWELWQPLRKFLVAEKRIEVMQERGQALQQQAVHASRQLLPLVDRIEQLRIDVVAEKVAHDESKRSLTAQSARQLAEFAEALQAHRLQELRVLARLHAIDKEERDERIAVLEREIAEDKHINALKGMVVDLESNLRRALDRRKQRKFAVLPTGGNVCAQCGGSSLTTFSGWKDLSKSLSQSLSEADLGRRFPAGDEAFSPLPSKRNWPSPEERSGQFSAVWR